MYRSFYIFRVPKQHVEAFVRINQEAIAIYRRYGALEGGLMGAAQLDAKYRCTGWADALQAGEDEAVFVSFDGFRDAAHHQEVMAKVDADPRINELFAELQKLIDLSNVLRGEFEDVG